MDVFDLFGRITLESNVEDQLSKDESTMSSFGSKVGSVLGGVAKVGAAAVGAAATAIGAISTQAVAGFARNEQLVGGIETLFGAQGMSIEQYAQSVGKSVEEVTGRYTMLMDAQSTALENADKAYITAGMSANNYMETISGFAASLKQSTENEREAVDVANMAVTDMADNSSKMGTAMDSIQNAYQGFAKQNYTMLDNLKLGYGGTKSEMERLLQDAQKLSGVEYNIENLSDVYNAIHVIQENLGITGTTAKEAMFTIEGSANATKAAWENVLVAIAKGEGLEDSLAGLTTALFGGKDGGGLLNNIIPRIKTTMEGIGNFIVEAVPLLTAKIPDLLNAIFPELLKSAMTLVGMLAKELPDILKILATTVIDAVNTILSQVSEAILGYNMFDSITSFATAVMDTLSTFIPNLITKGVDWLINFLSGFSDGETITNNISILFGAILVGLESGLPQILEKGIELVTFLINGILENYPTLITTMGELLSQLIAFIMENLPMFLEKGMELIGNIVDGVIQSLPAIFEAFTTVVSGVIETIQSHLPEFLEKGQELLGNIISGIGEKLPELLTTMAELLAQTLAKIGEHLPDFLEKGIELVGQIVAGLIQSIPDVLSWVNDVFNQVVSAFAGYDWLSIGANIVSGIIDGLAGGIGDIWNAGVNVAGNLFDSACNALGIASPSKKGRYIGEMFDLGIAKSLVDNAPTDAAEDMANSVYEAADIPMVRATFTGAPPADVESSGRGRYTGSDSQSSVYDLLLKYLPLLANMQVVLQDRTVAGKLAPYINEELGRMASWEAAQ